MSRYFLKLAYNGAGFHGWQYQPNALSVQEVVEKALSTILRCESIAITGAGRTDTEVNARVMYAHFDTEDAINDKGQMIRSLNSLLGNSVVVYDIILVHDDAHARFDATERTYKYFISSQKSPFDAFSWYCHTSLDFDAMNDAAAILLECDDFTSFSKLHTDVKTNICHVTRAQWEQAGDDDSRHVFTISADRFLRNMVRAVVGTLVDVGRGKLDVAGFKNVIDKKNRCEAGTSMPGHALFLWDIKYPYISDTSSKNLCM